MDDKIQMISKGIVSVVGTATMLTSTWNASPVGQTVNSIVSDKIQPTAQVKATQKTECKTFEGKKYCK
jgi:hypothetical protein